MNEYRRYLDNYVFHPTPHEILSLKEIDDNELQSAIDLFQEELNWDGMWSVEDAKQRIKDGWLFCVLKIDDKTLIDNVSDNSFHLRFDSTGTSNEFIGDDSKNVYENCTGGLPIRATKEDYGRAQDGTNVRDDEFAGTTSGTGLVLAVPLNTSILVVLIKLVHLLMLIN